MNYLLPSEFASVGGFSAYWERTKSQYMLQKSRRGDALQTYMRLREQYKTAVERLHGPQVM